MAMKLRHSKLLDGLPMRTSGAGAGLDACGWRRIRQVILCAAMVLYLVGCATPTVSPELSVRSVSIGDAAAGLEDAQLVGGKGWDWGRSILCEIDGRCALFGYGNKSFTESTDFFAIGEGADGKPAWARTYGGTHRELLSAVAPTLDGGYLLAGMSQSLFFTSMRVISPSRPPRPIVISIDAVGEPRWALTFDAPAVWLFGAAPTADGGHVLVGFIPGIGLPNPIVAVKLSAKGEVVWGYSYNFGVNAFAAAAVSTNDGGIAIAGYSSPDHRPAQNALLMKVDDLGAPLWAKLYDTDGRQCALSIAAMPDSSLVTTGWSVASSGTQRVYAQKVSSAGTPMWAFSLEGLRSGMGRHVILGHRSDMLIAGTMADGPHGGQDGLAVLLGSDGTPKASIVIGGPKDDEIRAAARLRDGRYRLFGSTESFDAAAVDALSVVWSPQSIRGETSPGLDPKPLAIHEMPSEVVRKDLEVRAVRLPLSSIESTKLIIPTTKKQ